MAFYSGSTGELLINGQRAARVSNWAFSSNLGVLDTTSLADTDKTGTPGIRSTSGSCSLFYYSDDITLTNSASTLINKLIKAKLPGGTPGQAPETELIQIKLKVNDVTTSGKYITGNVYLTSVSMSMAVGEVLSADCSFEFSGAPAEVFL